MANVNEAFEIENGLVIDGIALLVGATAPNTGLGIEAPTGSIYNQSGILWKKNSATNTDWSLVTTSSQQRFSRKRIASSDEVTILEDDEMILTSEINIEGDLIVLGEVTLL